MSGRKRTETAKGHKFALYNLQTEEEERRRISEFMLKNQFESFFHSLNQFSYNEEKGLANFVITTFVGTVNYVPTCWRNN